MIILNANIDSANLTFQYTVVGLILLFICVLIIWKLAGKKKKEKNSCCGCSLSDSCKRKIKN